MNAAAASQTETRRTDTTFVELPAALGLASRQPPYRFSPRIPLMNSSAAATQMQESATLNDGQR